MPVRLDISRLGARELQRKLARFDRDVAQKATRAALNRTINNMRATAIKESAKWMGIKRSLIEKRFTFNLATKHGGVGIVGARGNVRMEAKGIARGRPFNLVRWNGTRTAGGVSHKAYGRTQFAKGMSMGANPARFAFVVNRKGKNRRKRIGRGAYGPGLTTAVGRPDIGRAIEAEGTAKFQQHFTSRAREALRRAGYRRVSVR